MTASVNSGCLQGSVAEKRAGEFGAAGVGASRRLLLKAKVPLHLSSAASWASLDVMNPNDFMTPAPETLAGGQSNPPQGGRVWL